MKRQKYRFAFYPTPSIVRSRRREIAASAVGAGVRSLGGSVSATSATAARVDAPSFLGPWLT